MRFDIITLFPALFGPHLELGVTQRAFSTRQVDVRLWSLRDFADGNYRRVDDRPYGGGPGMVLTVGPLLRAVDHALADRACSAPVVLFAPTGRPMTQAVVADFAKSRGAVLVCGRYEGVDQRFIDARVTHCLSLGDFVLSGGELPALALLDAVARLQPGVLSEGSASVESFADGLLEGPCYSRPERVLIDGIDRAVPEALLSGNHRDLARYRRERSLALTAATRPDLLTSAREKGLLSNADERFLSATALESKAF